MAGTKIFIVFLTLLYISLQWCLKTTFYQVGLEILQVDWSPNGQYLAVGSAAKRVTVFSAVTSNILWYETLSNSVTTVKFSKSGKWLGVGQANSDTVRIYNVPEFTLNQSFKAGHSSNSTTIWELDFSFDGRKLVTCGSDGNVIQRNISTATIDWTRLLTANKNAYSCKFSSTNRVGVTCDDGDFYILKSDGTNNRTASKNYGLDLDFRAGDDRYYYSGCTCDDKVYQFDAQTGNLRFIFTGFDKIWTVSQSPDNSFLAAAGINGHFYIIDTTSRQNPVLDQYFKQPVDINSIRVSDDNNKVAVSRIDGIINIYVRTCSFCPTGYYLNVTCRICTFDIIGCASCKNSTLCYSCFQGYYLDNTTKLCVLCSTNLTGCALCSNNNTCVGCTSMYYLNGAACSTCESLTPFCEQCQSNGTCLKCSYYSYLTTNNTCSLCSNSIANCRACQSVYNVSSTSNSTLYCIQCTSGYYDAQTQCLPCTANCLFCLSNATCLACGAQYKLVGGSCVKCNTYCEACYENATCIDCIPTTFLLSGACSVCTYPCLTCSVSATNCTTCSIGYYMSGTNVCSKCVGCPMCNPVTGLCSICPIGQYIKSPANTCSFCLNTTSHCALCNETNCLACETNYYLSALGVCQIAASITNCLIHKKFSTTICIHCKYGYYLDANTTNSCLQCPSTCAVCESLTVCNQCHVGYYLAANSSCMPCLGNCRSCNSSTQCLSCGDQFYLSNTSCLLCSSLINNCTSCLNSTVCLDCSIRYKLASDSLSCIKCSSPCESCNSAGCLSCEQGYFYSTSTCTRCPNTCQSCTSASTCTSCVIGYSLNSTKGCVLCETLYPNCDICSYTACTLCKKYYTYNTTSSSCTLCSNAITNCLSCYNSTLCQFCTVGYYPAADRLSCINCSTTIPNCQKCINGSICDECAGGYYPNGNQCQKCISGCFSCSSLTTCDKCEPGFMKVNNTCNSCSSQIFGCKMCDTASNCTNCYLGYYLASSTSCSLCKASMDGCLVCSSSSVCVTCDKGYFLNSSSKCQSCSATGGCSECNKTTGACIECMTGYTFDNTSSCQLCSNAYNLCAVCNTTQCLRCESGAYFAGAGVCSSCQNLYTACIICTNTSCLQCQSGYYKASNGSCQPCTIQGCQICSSTGLLCLTCDSFHYMQNNSCVLCESMDFGCQHCTGLNTCLMCKSGYYLNTNGTCMTCETRFPACSQCTTSKCLVCQSNHYQNLTSPTGDCLSCGSYLLGCSLCVNQTLCLLCDSGYYLQNQTCASCTSLNQCLICQNNYTCLFCAQGAYMFNGTCLSCSSAIVGCFSCISSAVCLVCSGSYSLSGGICVQVKGTIPKEYAEIKVVSEYMNKTHLRHTLYAVSKQFTKIQQKWSSVTKITLIIPPKNKTLLTILKVQWFKSNGLMFYTDNPIGQILNKNNGDMPIMTTVPDKRILLQVSDLNMKIGFTMSQSAVSEILPTLDTGNSDLSLQYDTSEPEFYKSIIKDEKYHYYLFGVSITAAMLFVYLLKICFIVPTTNDTGQIIPHILLIKVCAMVIYPSYGGFINYCFGFTFLDFPWLNQYFSENLSSYADGSIASFKMFYRNMNIASTYLLALSVFVFVYLLCTLGMFYKKSNKIGTENERKNEIIQKSVRRNQRDQHQILIFSQFRSFLYNVFIAGLAFSSFSSIIGMFINSLTVISLSGVFYLLGVIVYTIILADAVFEIVKQKTKFNKIRVCIKASLMAMMSTSPIGLFTALAVIDTAMMLYQYKIKIKEWVVPKIWMLSHSLCIVSYSLLIFLANSLVGIIAASLLILIVCCLDCYLQYCEHLEYQKIQSLQQKRSQKFQRNLSIEAFVPTQIQQNQTFTKFDLKEVKGIEQMSYYQRSLRKKNTKVLKTNQKVDSLLALKNKDVLQQQNY